MRHLQVKTISRYLLITVYSSRPRPCWSMAPACMYNSHTEGNQAVFPYEMYEMNSPGVVDCILKRWLSYLLFIFWFAFINMWYSLLPLSYDLGMVLLLIMILIVFVLAIYVPILCTSFVYVMTAKYIWISMWIWKTMEIWNLNMALILADIQYRADSRFASSQWETSLQSNAISHWLGANL